MKDEGLKHIVAGCRNNDRRSQKSLYDRYYGYALTVALPYCSLETEAREVLNDAFLKVFTSIGRYDERLPFTAWLRTIVLRTAINHYHKHINDFTAHETTNGLDLSVDDDFLSKLEAAEVTTDSQQHIPVTVQQGGKAVDPATFENYLGEKAHLVLVEVASKEFVHTHPSAEGGRLDIHTTFAKPGIYRGWLQFQTGGKVHTADFVVKVVAGETGAQPVLDGRSEH